MSPKGAPSKSDKISLENFKFGLANSVLWDREILCDFIADRIDTHGESLGAFAEKIADGGRSAIFEVCAICYAVRKHRNEGMQVEIAVNLAGIAGFVTWSKEELFRCVVDQVRFFADAFRAADVTVPADIAEVINLCTAILYHDDPARLESIEEVERVHRAVIAADKKAA